MAWWGTLVGGALGYMLGGPLGAMLGASLGRNFDRGIHISGQAGHFQPGEQQRVQAAFFTATFSIMGYIAKSDGQVTNDEIASCKSIMDQMQLDQSQRAAAIKLFNEGKKPDFPLDDILVQFKQECHRRTNLIQVFLEIQVATAMADGHLHKNEKKAIYYIGSHLGLHTSEIDQIFNVGGSHSASSNKQSLSESYAILSVSKTNTDAEIKKAYRRLMSQHHPDKLISKGLPEEMIKIATQKTQEIKAAYEHIKKSRN